MNDLDDVTTALAHLARQAEYVATAIGMTARNLPADRLRKVVAAADQIRSGQRALLTIIDPANQPLPEVLVDFAGRIFVDGTIVGQVSSRSADVMVHLARSLGEVVPTEVLVENIWGGVGKGPVVSSAVTKIRDEIIGTGLRIETVRGVGYRLVVDQGAALAAAA
jgi:DNA-binding response OmpR family regulator